MEFQEFKKPENKENLDTYSGWIIVRKEEVPWLKSIGIKLGEDFDVTIKGGPPEIMFENCEVSMEMLEILKKESKDGRLLYDLKNEQQRNSQNRHRARDL